MIDTDKYEGHHKAWVNEYGDVVKLVYPNEESPSLDADQRLISDAQLLLEAYKQFREQYTELREALVGDSPNWTHEELVEIALEYKDISTKTENGIQMLANELEFGEWHTDMGEEE